MAISESETKPDRGSAIYRALRHAIIAQALMPGAKLPEDTIGEQFGVSRTIVRNALAKLAAEGLVELRRNRGAAVAAPSWDEARDIFDIRIALEQFVALRLTGHLTAEHLRTLTAHLHKEQRASESDPALSIELATEFHILLAAMTGSAVLKRYVSELSSRCGLILALYSRPHSSECAVSEHRLIIAALKSNDGQRAAKAMTDHLEAVVQRALIKLHPIRNQDIRAVLAPYAETGRRKRKAPNGR